MKNTNTVCLHPEIETAMLKWLTTRSHPAFLLIGPPGVGKSFGVEQQLMKADFVRVGPPGPALFCCLSGGLKRT